MTLLGRLEMLRDLTPIEPGKRKTSWAALARLSGIQRTSLGTAVSRLERGMMETLDAATAAKLVRPFGASIDWLLTGEGTGPAGSSVAKPARYPNLDDAIRMRGAKWGDDTLDSLAGLKARSPTDFSVGTWINLGDEIERSYREGRELGEPLPDVDDVPPAGRR